MSSVDVIVPCYRYGHFLRECVESVLAQSGVDVHVLVIDDNSPDNTSEIGAQLASEDSRVTFLKHSTNVGNIDTYNEGIDWCSSDYMLLLSADDYLLPGSLARALAVLDAHPDAVLACGQAVVADEGQPFSHILPEEQRPTYTIITGDDFIETACEHSFGNPIYTATAVVRTSAQKTVGHYNSKLPHAGDLEMWLRLARVGSVAMLDSYQAVWRRHGSNMHYLYAGVPNLRQHLLAFESALVNYSGKRSNQVTVRTKYMRGLGIGAIRAANHALNENDLMHFKEARAFAIDVFPAIRHTRYWYAMQLRKLLGYTTVNLLRRVLRPVLPVWKK